jgi:N-methylhydantoinase A
MRTNGQPNPNPEWCSPLYLGIDVGGTFSDFFLVSETGDSYTFKYFSSPEDPSRGVLEGLKALAAGVGLPVGEFMSRICRIVHGTTIATNALITGSTAKTGFITTAGFRDIANMRRGLRGEPFDGKLRPPAPLVSRHLIGEVGERVNCEGEIVRALDVETVKPVVDQLLSQGVESIAVSLLFSFLEPKHEKLIAEVVRNAAKGVFLCTSHEVLPQIGAYERHCTTILNAKVGPVIDKYLDRLLTGLRRDGFTGELYIMQSNGGVSSPAAVRRLPVNTLLSGPAAGPTAANAFADDHAGVIAADMGGTSFEVSVIHEGNVALTSERDVGGYRVATPGLRIHSVGAGGGSIAWVEEGTILRVGPASSGAVPGPACYGKGGEQPTVTDAQVVLGYLHPEAFLGGRFVLRSELAEKALEGIAQSLGLDCVEAAAGIYQIVNANMAGAIRVVTVQEGIDPRDHLLVMGGGAGPVHAAAIAAELGIREVLIPRVGPVMCAFGMLMADFHHHFVRTAIRSLRDGVEDPIQRAVEAMTREAEKQAEGTNPEEFSIRSTLELRYSGQFHEVEIPLADLDVAKIRESFHQRHATLYGYSDPGSEVELVNVHVYSVSRTKKPARGSAAKDRGIDQALKEKRNIFFQGRFVTAPVYDGSALGSGARIDGPCLIEYPDTAVVVQPYCGARTDTTGNLRMAVDL